MKKVLHIFLFSFCLFVIPTFSQKSEPKLIGTWTIGYEDYNHFVYDHLYISAISFVEEYPNAKWVIRLCSNEKMSVALVSSYGFAFDFPRNAKNLRLPADKVFFARWSKCPDKSEQYWIVPENSNFEYDEMIAAEKIEVKRWLASSYDKPSRQAAEKEFADYVKEFVAELKNNPKAEGFIIRNLKVNNRKLKEALKQIQNAKIDRSRFQILKKRVYDNYHPEFMTVTVQK